MKEEIKNPPTAVAQTTTVRGFLLFFYMKNVINAAKLNITLMMPFRFCKWFFTQNHVNYFFSLQSLFNTI